MKMSIMVIFGKHRWRTTRNEFRDDYQKAFEDMLENTSTDWAPWFVIRADNEWFARLSAPSLLAP
jgi:polyphosphate kinase 2 (PPK2 family)